MSKLSENLEVRRGPLVCPDDFARNLVTYCLDTTGNVRDWTPDANQEWFLEAKVRVTFWANQAQVRDAEKIAYRALMAGLYSDVLAELAYLRKAISDSDKSECYRLLDYIDDVLKGERK